MLNIITKPHHITNHIIKNTIITTNIYTTHILHNKLNFNIYNIHINFNPTNANTLTTLLKTHNLHINAKKMLTLNNFYKLHHKLNTQPTNFLNNHIHHFQSFTKINTKPNPHFNLNLKTYTT